MARIFKGSRYQLQLLVSKTSQYPIEDVTINFFTTNPDNPVEVREDITINGNIATVTIGSTQFDSLEDGLLNYIITGTVDGASFISERQSNYYLKNETQYNPETGASCNLISISEIFVDQNGEGEMVIYASDHEVDGFNEVHINASNYGWEKYSYGYNDGYNLGKTEGSGMVIGQLNTNFIDKGGDGTCWWYPHENGCDAFNYVSINASEYGQQRYEQGLNDAGGGTSCNLQDRWMTPDFDNIINDNFLIVSPVDDENGPYDGMSRVVITRTEASAPNLMYGVYQAVYGDALSQGETILSYMSDYTNENNGSLNGFFDDGEFINADWKRYMAFTLEQGWYDGRLTDMSYMYNGDGIVPIVAFYGFNCENTETIEGAFNGWTKLYALEKLFMLGNSFRQEQTLDLSMTNLNDNPNTKCLIKQLFDFNYAGHNQYDVTTSYIKGLSNFRQDIEERGWQCID